MSLNITQLSERVAGEAGFSSVEQVNDSIIRSTRKFKGRPFAVYYFDLAQELPGTPDTLAKYQDQVIGKHYFDGEKSLQWSNYLYFITSKNSLESGKVRDARILIERDRNYARKFVISEEELYSVLKPPATVQTESTPHNNILNIWMECLSNAGIDRAILIDNDLPSRLKQIEDFADAMDTRQKAPKPIANGKKEPIIRSLRLETFRAYPKKRDYKFGTVNLIFGANGSGKTSLLEAIELLYCGKNKRNPNINLPYKIETFFSDNSTEIATDNRALQIYRDRNSKWYGQHEVKTNNLYQSFAQFNFLDTDAAVDLADSTNRIEDDLSKLLVGPEASKVWMNIVKVTEEIAKRINSLRPLMTTIKDELSLLEKRFLEANNIQPESDSINKRLEEMIQRIGWPSVQVGKEIFATKLVESLSELLSLLQQVTEIVLVNSPISMAQLIKYCNDAKAACEKGAEDITKLEALQKQQKFLAVRIDATKEAKSLVKRAIAIIESGLPAKVADYTKQQDVVAIYSECLTGIDAVDFELFSSTERQSRVDYIHNIVTKKRIDIEASLAEAKKEYENFSKLRDRSISLAQQLREIASKIIPISDKPDECPLCHTQFKHGELTKHINYGVEEHIESIGQTFLTQINKIDAALKDAKSLETMSNLLKTFCVNALQSDDITVDLALTEIKNTMRLHVEAQTHLEELRKDIFMLNLQGYSIEELESISTRLREIRYPLVSNLAEEANQLLSTIDQMLENSSQTLMELKEESDVLQKSMKTNVYSFETEEYDLRVALSRLKERIITTENLRVKIGKFISYFPWPEDRPLSELLVEGGTIQRVAADLLSALAKEKQAAMSQADSIKRKKELEQKLTEMIPREERLNKAYSTLKQLQEEHSLNSAMEVALKENRQGIESIFTQIHSPVEFAGLGTNLTNLVRKIDGKEVGLSQISTGQRAAFALSIFLAQNAQLKNAPPVILIDDPIAHVDDMNSLSFLDYLREIVLRSQRQIFFATASDKLATLFERKFDFLGQGSFCRFNLNRE